MTKVTAPRISVAQDRRMPPKVKNQPLSVETFFDPHHNLQAIVRTPTDPILSSPKLEPGWIPPSLRIGPPPSKLKLGPRLRRQLMTPQAFTPLARCPPSFPRPVRRRVQPRGQPFLTVPGQRLNRNRSLRRPLHDILAHESTLYIPANLSSIEVFASTAPVPEIVVTPEISSKGFWAVSSYVAGTALPSSNGYYNGTAESRGSAMYDAGFSDGKRVVFDTPMHSEIVAKLPRKWTDMEAV
ncbi:hypothetical protein EJ08DRAFT_648101 [Tothia fuscella]|uniref:Uncharacterized protein n=1 Tax=Tothia fuscella TaxID=1048955 RepID=A0A9P4NVV3_9PEZI|nr:hypothetical protein EJ08DRAFT_648101 [Tothia fuscella]